MIDREEVRTDSQQAVVRLALLIFDVNLIKLSKHWERRGDPSLTEQRMRWCAGRI